ncbi:MAG: YhjD/YihY/BrkB family envelope integrity protein [Nakamurella sp.]
MAGSTLGTKDAGLTKSQPYRKALQNGNAVANDKAIQNGKPTSAGVGSGRSALSPDAKPPVPEDPSTGGKLVLRGKRIASKKSVKHLIRAVTRYGDRLGSQFAGAMTYFSFLSLIPILMVGFSVAGVVLRNNTALLDELKGQIGETLPGEFATQITGLIDGVVANPLSIGIIGLLIATYSGIGWMANLRKAIRAIWRPEFEENKADVDNFVVALVKDLGALIGLGAAIVISLGLSAFASNFAVQFLDLIGLGEQTWLAPFITVLSLLIAMAADVLIFMWVYTILPGKRLRSPFKARLRGSILAAVGFEILKFALTTLVPGISSGSATFAVFGSVISVLFFFNLVSQLVLFVAAWVATAEGGPELDDGPLPEVPEATLIVRKDSSATKAAALVGVGAAAGWVAAKFRR